MKNIGYATVIHCEGPAGEVYVNDILNKEIKKLNEKYKKDMAAVRDELGSTKEQRDRLLAEKVKELDKMEAQARNTKKHKSISSSICNCAEVFWAMIWYFGLRLGWWGARE